MKDSPYKDIFSYAVATWVIMFLICAPIYLLITYDSLELNIPVHGNEKNDYSKTDIIKTLERCKITIKGDKPIEKKKACSKAAKELNNYIKDKRNLNAQEGIWRVSTELLKLTTYHLIAIIVSIFASIAGLYFIIQNLRATKDAISQSEEANRIANEALMETQKTNVLQLKPYLDIGDPVVSKFQGVEDTNILFTIDTPIINTGPTPVTRAIIEISNFKLYVFAEGVRVAFLPTEHLGSREVYTKPVISDMSTPINPKGGMPYKHTTGSMFVRGALPDAARSRDLYENEGVGFSFFATIRFKDISTTGTKHRALRFNVSKNTGSAELDGRGVTTPNETVEDDNGIFDKEY